MRIRTGPASISDLIPVQKRRIGSKTQAIFSQIWNYAHLPLILGIGVAGVGFRRTVSVESDSHLSSSESRILTSAVTMLMVALISMGATSVAMAQALLTPRENFMPKPLLRKAC